MKKFIAILILMLAFTVTFAQYNYKEGDFTGKQIKGKTVKLDNEWIVGKSSADVLEFKFQNTLVGQLTSAGALTVTGLTNSGTSTFTGATTLGAVTMSSTVTGNVLFRDTAAFVTSATRRAKYIAGASATDFYVATVRGTNGSTRPVAGDVVSVVAKADSVILERQTGTTSGAIYNIIRIK